MNLILMTAYSANFKYLAFRCTDVDRRWPAHVCYRKLLIAYLCKNFNQGRHQSKQQEEKIKTGYMVVASKLHGKKWLL
jgi:hypothetical protein